MNQPPETLHSLLSDEQRTYIERALEEGTLTQEVLSRILEHTVLPKEEKYALLVREVIEPYQQRDQLNHIKDAIKQYKHQLVGVPATQEKPPYLYTVGGIDRFGGELLYVGNMDFTDMGNLINYMVFEFDRDGFKEDVGQIADADEAGTPLRYQWVHACVKDHTEDFLTLYPLLFPHYHPETPLYVLEIGDRNNRLPGEPGYDKDLRQFSETITRLKKLKKFLDIGSTTVH
jgi:hypothetical protein